MLSSKKINLLRDFAAGVYFSEDPSPLRFLFEVVCNFVGSKSGQIQSVKLLQNMFSNRTQNPSTLPGHTLFDTMRGGGRV
jgi:hypothetical protein